MNRSKVVAMLAISLLCGPVVSAAMEQHAHGAQQDPAAAAESHHHGTADHGGQGMAGEPADSSAGSAMSMLGSHVSKGVKGMAHIGKAPPAMASKERAMTHRFMIAFVDEASGKTIAEGAVALKIISPDAKTVGTLDLIAEDGHFGTDIDLAIPGEYHFRLDTKLIDGVNRKYHFHYVN